MLDHSLIYQAQKYITGANVHDVMTWIACYQLSATNTKRRQRYEKLLRKFVAKQRAPHGKQIKYAQM
jgi:hypothetical protein